MPEVRPMPADSYPKEPGLLRLEQKWFVRRLRQSHNGPQVLYHCTGTIDAVLGMANSGEIWATDVRFLNDRAEIWYGTGLLLDLMESRPVPGSDVGKRLIDFVRNAVPNQFDWLSVLVMCLGTESDVANQWFMYADRGKGYELAFDRGPKRTLVVRDRGAVQTPAVLEPVTYDPEVQSQQLLEVLDDAVRAVEHICAMNIAADLEDVVHRAGSSVVAELAQRIAVMKHPSFRYEFEWRIMYVHDPKSKDGPALDYRGPNHNIPFLRLQLRAEEDTYPDKLPLQQVLIGPHAETQIGGVQLSDLLARAGHTDATLSVREAECPLQVSSPA